MTAKEFLKSDLGIKICELNGWDSLLPTRIANSLCREWNYYPSGRFPITPPCPAYTGNPQELVALGWLGLYRRPNMGRKSVDLIILALIELGYCERKPLKPHPGPRTIKAAIRMLESIGYEIKPPENS